MANPCGSRNARSRALGTRMADFRRPQVSQHRHDDGGNRSYRPYRARVGEIGFPENRELYGGALGHDLVMRESGERRRSFVRGTLSLLVAAAAYEALARSGYF